MQILAAKLCGDETRFNANVKKAAKAELDKAVKKERDEIGNMKKELKEAMESLTTSQVQGPSENECSEVSHEELQSQITSLRQSVS